MKQILQSLQSGATEVADVPAPAPSRGAVLIDTSRTLISVGTERMLVDFGKAGLVGKARQQPERVKMVVDKIRTDGLMPTVASIRNKLGQPLALGYCNVGVVAEVGSDVSGFEVGDRVASNGKHAEVVAVPVNLCCKIPDGVSDDQAAFTVVAAIGLQGIRLVEPTLGEAVAVTGLGLIGLITVQLLRAHGCRVLGIDFDPAKLALARQFGAETVDLSAGQDPVAAAQIFSRGRGVDAVLITAATQSSEPMHQAALMSRQRGRIVLVGVAGLELSRDDFFKKELTFQVSSSYGPGRYDPNYEEKGRDYPVGFVRWTENRNFEAVLDMLADGRLNVEPLISHRFAIEEAERAYALISGGEPSMGVVLEYRRDPSERRQRTVSSRSSVPARVPAGTTGNDVVVDFIGSGNYATAVLIPAFKDAGASLRVVASQSGVTGLHAARKFGFAQTTTDPASVLGDAAADTVVISTRHDSHARYVIAALAAGKNVFVEKPLCLTLDELSAIEQAVSPIAAPRLMVGFNRRFAPQVARIKSLTESVPGPKSLIMTVNAGVIPADHWTQDAAIGGGRIIGEACHFVDLLRFLAAAPIIAQRIAFLDVRTRDTATIQLAFADGSIGAIHYFSNGPKSFPKERLEVFASGRVLQLDNFRKLSAFGWPGVGSSKLWRQDKGQRACAQAFVDAVRANTPMPIPFEELIEVSRVTIDLAHERDPSASA